jgi:hypothetical protein
MKGAFYCPHCKTPNACTCKNCKSSITDKDTVGVMHAEYITCGMCGDDFSYDEALDTEWKLFIEPARKNSEER